MKFKLTYCEIKFGLVSINSNLDEVQALRIVILSLDLYIWS
jgi:hypothetical protein